MPQKLKIAANRLLGRLGYHIARGVAGSAEAEARDLAAARARAEENARLECPSSFEADDVALWRRVREYTCTGPLRIHSLSHAVEYIVRAGIPGAFVECGVWKGGSAMAMALTLNRLKDQSREIYLYDTFDEGWPAGGPDDVMEDGATPQDLWEQTIARGETLDMVVGKYDQVFEAMQGTQYPMEKMRLVRGKVEDTIPQNAPEQIALLRLDTDWYESTRHELEHLYPRLRRDGVLIIDDYGYWRGARKATDEYFAANNIHMLLHRVDDHGCRIGVKGH